LVFLPFSVWSISSKLTDISGKLHEIRTSARSHVEGIDRLKQGIDGLAGRLDRTGRGPADKGS